jgi:HK97 family phage prohead protease
MQNKKKILEEIQSKNKRAFIKLGYLRKAEPDYEKGIIPVSFTSDSVEVNDYYFGALQLSHKKGHYDYSRLENNGKVFVNHNTNELPIGVLRNIKVEGGVSRAEIHLDMQDPEAVKVLGKVQRGFLDGVSMGFNVHEIEETGQKNSLGFDIYRAVKWEANEVSLVGIEADTNVGVGRNINSKGAETMVIENKSVVGIEPENNLSDGERKITEEVAKAVEKTRIELEEKHKREKEENEAFTRALESHCEKFPLTKEQKEHCIKERSLDIARTYSLNNYRAEPHKTGVEVSDSRGQNFVSDMADAILFKALPEQRKMLKLSEGSKAFRNIKLFDIAKIICERSGMSSSEFYSKHPLEIANRALGKSISGKRGAYNGTGDFSNIMLDAINKFVAVMPEISPDDGWREIAKVRSVSDFKSIYSVSASEMAKLSAYPIPESGEYKHVRMGDHKETYALSTYGYVYNLSRQAIINDDLNMFQDFVEKMIKSANQLPMELLCAKIVANASMGLPAGVLCGTAHGNLLGDLAPSTANYEAISKALMKQRSLPVDGNSGARMLNLMLGIILCTPETYWAHKNLIDNVNDIDATTGTAKKNAFGGLKLISSANLWDALTSASEDTDTYYGLAPKSQFTNFEVAFLNGVETPYVEEKETVNVDGTQFLVRHDCGVGVTDFRGIVKVAYQA